MKLSVLADRLGCRLEGDGSIEIRGVASLEQAGPGDVTFFADGFPIGHAPLVNTGGSSQATFVLNRLLSMGAHVVSAAYGGSAGFAASTSIPAVQVVQ